MPSTLTNIILHVVFSTKNRERLVGNKMKSELYPYIGGIIRGEKGLILSIGGTSDHLHVLAKFPAAMSVSDLVKRIKGHSSKWINDQPWQNRTFAWQRGYAAFSVSQSMVEKVAAYIESQEEHHRISPFKEELISLLKKHGVEYDEKYLF